MLRAVFFDMGGTLDGDGLHWLDRFVDVYSAAGVVMPREAVRSAFDAAELRAATDVAIMTAHLDEMIERHVGWQLEHLRATGTHQFTDEADARRFHQDVVSRFAGPIRTAAAANVPLLASLHARGLQLGVVSNGCGNVDLLCGDLGYAPYLSLIVDSRRVGLSKPDPAIFAHAAARIGLPPTAVMMVGDSFERDVQPARSIGMKTAWLEGAAGRPCPDRAAVDLLLRTLADLPVQLDARSRDVA